VPQDSSLHLGLCLLAVTWLTAGPHLLADSTPVAPPGYKIVNVPSGSGTIPVMVKEQKNPFGGIPSGDLQKSFSVTNSMANKKFLSGSDANFQNDNHSNIGTFSTKAYQDPALASSPNFNTKANLPTAAGFDHGANGFNRAFPTANVDSQTRTSSFAGTSTSSYQNRSATLGGPAAPEQLASNSMANKQYLGPGAQNVPAAYHLNTDVVLSRMTGLPDRPLSIDEVRDLINHGAKPDTDVKPDAPSKPLNDPAYQPEPLRDTPTRANDDDKNDSVPAPGMIAAPENAEPLPQK
jgi:hypothetical protein